MTIGSTLPKLDVLSNKRFLLSLVRLMISLTFGLGLRYLMIKAVKAGMGNYMWLADFAQFAIYETNWYVVRVDDRQHPKT